MSSTVANTTTPSSPTLPPSTIVIEGDAKSQFAVDLDSRFMTACSVIFTGHSLPASDPVIIKLSRTTLTKVAATLDETHIIHTLFAAAVASHNAEPESAVEITHASCGCNDDDFAGCTHEIKIHSFLHAHHAAHPEKLSCVVLALDTLASGEALILPRHRPLQPDFRTPQMPLAEVARLATDLVQALTTVHDAGYVHCDVSVGNVVIACQECDRQLATLSLNDDAPQCPHVAATQPAVERPSRRYRLIDFGLCQKIEDANAVTSACGTPGFVAPEIMQVPPAAAVATSPSLSSSSSAFGMVPSFRLDPANPSSFSSQSPTISTDPSLHSAVGPYFTLSDVSSLSSTPPSDRMSFTSSVDGSVNSPRIAALRSISPSPPSAWRDLRFRLIAARDVYSVGVVVGLVLSGYLPLCDADHLGSARSSPDYVRAHVTPRLRVFRRVLADNVHLVAPGAFQVLDWAVDFVLRCLAYSPRARTPAKKLLRRHPMCEWVLGTAPTFDDVAVPVCMVDPSTWRRSASYSILKDAMEERRDEWEVSHCDFDAMDVAAEVAESSEQEEQEDDDE